MSSHRPFHTLTAEMLNIFIIRQDYADVLNDVHPADHKILFAEKVCEYFKGFV